MVVVGAPWDSFDDAARASRLPLFWVDEHTSKEVFQRSRS